jgi:hypothetical protein
MKDDKKIENGVMVLRDEVASQLEGRLPTGPRRPPMGPVVDTKQLVGDVMVAMRQILRDAMAPVALELKAIVEDNNHLRSNLAHLNEALGKFREHEAMPLRDALQDFNTNAASRVAENQANLEKLIQALCRALEAANIPIPEDISKEIRDGRFEGHDHEVDNAGGPRRLPGQDPLEALDET